MPEEMPSVQIAASMQKRIDELNTYIELAKAERAVLLEGLKPLKSAKPKGRKVPTAG